MDLFINGHRRKTSRGVDNYLFDQNGQATHKRCKKCGEWKRIEDEWQKNKDRPYGLQHYCKPCNNASSLYYHRIRRGLDPVTGKKVQDV